ncbi:hypothetical protein LPJ53_004841 [Coemansia erecta]|uniref:Phosphoglycerate mutase-like protein n=1 Tax=Coemansia erecta TaxID=147472 RepID=A0A9W7XYW7_9FUNG|nr:hypothetical protein LPJ53_004841 [Coemansia erecta]
MASSSSSSSPSSPPSAPEIPPPPAYSQAAKLPELTPSFMRAMYPPGLTLIQAQVFFRHGERTPVRSRILLDSHTWPFCRRANFLHAEFMKAVGRFVPRAETMPVPDLSRKGDPRYTRATGTQKCGVEYEPAAWSVRLEPSKLDDGMGGGRARQGGGGGEGSWDPDVCDMGQLSDVGLDSLRRAGAFLRALYVDRLGFLPPTPRQPRDWLYARTTDYSRVIQSTHALLVGLYPGHPPQPPASASAPSTLDGGWPAFNADFLRRFPIHTRMHADETMHGNFGCYNFIRHFIDATATAARRYKWIDDVHRQVVGLRSIGEHARDMLAAPHFGSNYHPIYDELVSLRAHGGALPADVGPDMLESLGAAAHYQWTHHVRRLDGQRLGFGRLVDNVVQTMAQAAALTPAQAADPATRPRIGRQAAGDMLLAPGAVRPPQADEAPRVPKLALYGGHDITVAPMAIILGATGREWLPFASMLTIELFKDAAAHAGLAHDLPRPKTVPAGLDTRGYFVRVRLNDQVLRLPTCEVPAKHHPQAGSDMCTLAAFFEHLAPVVASEAEYKAECGTMPSAEV